MTNSEAKFTKRHDELVAQFTTRFGYKYLNRNGDLNKNTRKFAEGYAQWLGDNRLNDPITHWR